MNNPISNPGALVTRVATGVFFTLCCLFVMNIGLNMINQASDVEFYIGVVLTLTPVGVLAYAAFRLYNPLVGNPPTEDN